MNAESPVTCFQLEHQPRCLFQTLGLTIMYFIDRLAHFWGLNDVVPDSQATDIAIDDFERRFGVQLPSSVRAFYKRFNGLLDDMDSDLNAFWSIQEVDTVAAKVESYYSNIAGQIPDSTQLFAFADHSIWVHVYAMRLSNDPSGDAPVIWIADGAFATLAGSFAGFWESYLASPHRILVP